MLTDLLGVIAVGLADEPDGIWKQHMAFCFLGFIFLPLFVLFIRDLLRGGYLDKWKFSVLSGTLSTLATKGLIERLWDYFVKYDTGNHCNGHTKICLYSLHNHGHSTPLPHFL